MLLKISRIVFQLLNQVMFVKKILVRTNVQHSWHNYKESHIDTNMNVAVCGVRLFTSVSYFRL